MDLSGKDLSGHLKSLLDKGRCGTEHKNFLLPDFLPQRTDWSEAQQFSDEPMPLSKVRRLGTLLLRSKGAPQDLLDAIDGLYSCRRIEPTLAQRSTYSVPESLEVGGWVDSADKARSAMPRLYSEAKMYMQFQLKGELVDLARRALAIAFDDEKLSSHPSWEDLFAVWPARGNASSSSGTCLYYASEENVKIGHQH